MAQNQALTLSQFSTFLANAINNTPSLKGQWVVAETMDVRVSGGHCYLELIEKDESSGRPLARMRATIWSSTFRTLSGQFYAATGQQFRSDLKVMVCVTAIYHAVYGFSLQILAINPAYTLGDAMRRRNEMINKLRAEGIIDDNRRLQWPSVPQRIAIISASGAAGYGDFMHQLYNNGLRLRFTTRLFPATMQGERTGESIIAALNAINEDIDHWDCVVIIRGGGATSDLAAFDNYDLAANIAQFPLPVIIGIGHERDITLLDYVANMRVKTPTAAAEWLIARGQTAYGRLQAIAQAMLQSVTDRLNGCHQQLAYISGSLPAFAMGALSRSRTRLVSAQASIATIGDSRLKPQYARLDAIRQSLVMASSVAISRSDQKLQSIAGLLAVLSPESTLKRGYSITRVNGRAVHSVADVPPGTSVETTLLDGSIISISQ